MKKKIAILGSTGSIGKSLLEIIKEKDFEITFLAANKNYRKLLKQAETFNVKNLIITDHISYKKLILINKNKKIKIYNCFNSFKKIIAKKLDYVMCSISGISGLKPTYDIIKFTKKIAIANKESLICAWPILQKELRKHNTEFVPVDSEHFSVWSEIKEANSKRINKIYLTASGGPLYKLKISSLKNVKNSTILNHPTWSMGKKISVDSATMMNKCLEVMEAKNIFDLDYKKISFIIHPESYVHAIVVYNNGISKIIVHDTTMKIPIFNTIFNENAIYRNMKKIDFKKLNHLNFQDVMIKKYPIVSFLNKIPKKHSLYETVILSINDTIVDKFLAKKIQFNDISTLFLKFLNKAEFKKYKRKYPKNIMDIINLNNVITKKISMIIKKNKKNYVF